MGARTASVALIHHIIVIHSFVLFFDGFGWFWRVFGRIGMVWGAVCRWPAAAAGGRAGGRATAAKLGKIRLNLTTIKQH